MGEMSWDTARRNFNEALTRKIPMGHPELWASIRAALRRVSELEKSNKDMHRRAQRAEAALKLLDDPHPPSGNPNMGRALANAAATKYKMERDAALARVSELESRLAAADELAGAADDLIDEMDNQCGLLKKQVYMLKVVETLLCEMGKRDGDGYPAALAAFRGSKTDGGGRDGSI